MAQKARLLVVEDEDAIRSGLVDVFVYHGYEVDTADNGDDGLRQALSGRYDLVLLDVMLPGVDGFEICNRIRQQDRQQPVIMLTAKSSDEDIVQGLTLGADDYVAKLRRKIEADSSNPETLITVRGAGYRLMLTDA